MATPSPAAEAPAGVWLSLERLRELPLTAEARLALLRDLQVAQPSQAPALALSGELAEVTLRCCEDAYNRGDWTAALELHDALVPLVEQLARAVPEQSTVFWSRYGELLAFLTAAVHTAVNDASPNPPEPLLRAELCSQLSDRLQQARQWPCAPPDWLAVLEQQLVQMGAVYWYDLLPTAAERGARTKALELLLRLQTLLNPVPHSVLAQARDLLHQEASALMELAEPSAHELWRLLHGLERLPVEAPRKDALAMALTRARLGLELLAPELGSLSAPVENSPDVADENEPVLDPAGVAVPALAELVFLEAGAVPTQLQLDLAPLLSAEFEEIEQALDDFIWHLPNGYRAFPAAPALVAALEPRWAAGLLLEAPSFERLAYLAAAWQRRLGEKLEPLPILDWQQGLLVELAATELAVLQPLLANSAAMEPALGTLRREHLNEAFWQERHEVPWMQCPPPLEALRRLHREEGFYARSHEPLKSLRAWEREATLALQDAALWTDDAGCLGLWLAVAQELVASLQEPLPLLGAPPPVDQLLADLGGLEVLYVGTQARAVQAAHRAGRCVRGEPFGLRVLEPPVSCWPARPAGSFEESLAVLLEAVDGLYRQRPFAVLLADCGAYRLPLLRAVHQRYGVSGLSSHLPMAGWLGA